MNTRTTRAVLWLLFLTQLVLATSVVVWHGLSRPTPRDLSRSVSLSNDSEGQDNALRGDRKPDQTLLRRTASRDFRQRLFDPPVVAPKPPPPKPLPPVELISTILRSQGDPSAWIRDGQTTRKVSIGDKVGPDSNPASVLAIHADRLVLDHESGEIEVARDKGGRR